MNVQTLVVGALSTNCYLLWDDAGHALAIDPGDEADRILEELAARALTLDAILLTHLHVDHVLAVPALTAATGARLILPKEEKPALTDDLRSLMVWLPPQERLTLCPDRFVTEGDTVQVGEISLSVWHTPGHTAGSSCYVTEDTVFAGDTLFAGSVGRTDFPSGDLAALQRSLSRLAADGGTRRVLSGHGAPTDIGTERRTNPYMK